MSILFEVSDAPDVPNLQVSCIPSLDYRSSWMAVGFFPLISLKIFPLAEFPLSSFPSCTTAGLPLPSSLFFLMSTLPQCQRLAGHVLMRWPGAQVLFQYWSLRHLQKRGGKRAILLLMSFRVTFSALFLGASPSTLPSLLLHLLLESS